MKPKRRFQRPPTNREGGGDERVDFLAAVDASSAGRHLRLSDSDAANPTSRTPAASRAQAGTNGKEDAGRFQGHLARKPLRGIRPPDCRCAHRSRPAPSCQSALPLLRQRRDDHPLPVKQGVRRERRGAPRTQPAFHAVRFSGNLSRDMQRVASFRSLRARPAFPSRQLRSGRPQPICLKDGACSVIATHPVDTSARGRGRRAEEETR